MFRSVFAVVLVGLQVAIAGAQRDTDVAAPRCKDMQKLKSFAGSVLLDVETLASVKNDIQHVLDCLPRGGAIQLFVSKLDLGGTLVVHRPVSIRGLATLIVCPHGNMRPIIDVRSDDVLLAGLSLAGCKLNGPSGLIEVKGSQNVTLKDVVFENNANTGGPSCVSAIESTIRMQRITAKNNLGTNGGAMSFAKASEVAIVSSYFKDNHASEWGGAIHTHNSNCSISYSLFVANHAFDGGGALLAKGDVGSKLSIEDALFDGNGEYKNCSIESRGGGIALFGPKLSAKIASTLFVNNSACTGGAIHVFDVTKVAIQDSIFNENFAFRGGALYIEVGILQVDRCWFSKNSAQGTVEGFSPMGGVAAIFNNGTEAAFHECVFFKNKAGVFGGALGAHMVGKVKILGCEFIENMVGNMSLSGEQEATNASLSFSNGGAVSVKSANAVFILKSRFTRNLATGELEKDGVLIMETDSSFGGAVSMEDVEQTFIVESNFTRNSAGKGGGVALAAAAMEDVVITIEGSHFIENVATLSDGGALALLGEHLTCFVKESIFQRNKANDGGGAIHAGGINQLNLETSSFVGNKCALPIPPTTKGQGGGVHVSGTPSVLFLAVTFINNEANHGGGAHIFGGTNSTLLECTFTRNRAEVGGGAVHAEIWLPRLLFPSLSIKRSRFSENRAGNIREGLLPKSPKGGGGALKIHVWKLTLADCVFKKNMAASGGSIYMLLVDRLEMSNLSISTSVAALGGGGLAAVYVGTVFEMTQVIFSRNSASWGGGISFDIRATGAVGRNRAQFTNVEFLRNTATRGAGMNLQLVQLNCMNCRFFRNVAGKSGDLGDGGGILASFSILTLENSIVKECSAARSGGGVYLQDATLTGVNLTVSGNTASENGGGIAASFASALAPTTGVPLWNYNSCFIEDNKSKIGGGLYLSVNIQSGRNCLGVETPPHVGLGQVDFIGEMNCRMAAPFFDLLAKKSNQTGYLLGIMETTVIRNTAHIGPDGFFNDISAVRMCCGSKCYNGADLRNAPLNCKTRDGREHTGSMSLASGAHTMALLPAQIRGQASNRALPSIAVQILDVFDRTPLEKVILRIQSTTPDMDLFGSPATGDGIIISSSFNVTGVILRGLPGTYNVTFELIPAWKSSRSIMENLTVVLRGCVAGEIPKHGGKRCDLCGEEFFSFDPNDTECHVCPLEKAKCSGPSLVPLQGFWHANTRAMELHPCMSAEGCTYSNRTKTLEQASKDSANKGILHFTSDSYPQCTEGYTDVLCGSCQPSHGKVRCQKCMECRGDAPATVFLSLVVLALVILSLVFMESAGSYSKEISNGSSDVSIAGRSLPSAPRSRRGFNLGAFLAGRIPDNEAAPRQLSPRNRLKEGRASDAFKILVNFLQVTGAAAAINVDWSKSMLASLASLGLMSGAISNSFFAPECAFKMNGLPRSIKAASLFVLLPGVVWVTFSFWYVIRSLPKHNRFQHFKIKSFTALLAVMYASYLSVTTEVVRIFYCVRAEPLDGLFWAEDTSVVCYRASHAYLTGFIGVPFLVVVTVGFPGWLLFVLTRNKANLTVASMAKRYGFFYKSYKKDTVIWEVVILARKALVSVIVVFGRPLGGGLQSDLVLAILFISTVLQVLFQPFTDPKLNTMELASLLLSNMAFVIGNMANKASVTMDANIGMSVVFIAMVVGYFLYMGKQIFSAGMRGVERWAREDQLLTAEGSTSLELVKVMPHVVPL